MDTTDLPSLLLVILDLHPISWALSANQPQANGSSGDAAAQEALSLTDALSQVLVFLNAHLASRWANELVVHAAMSGGRSELLYSSHAPDISLSHSIPANSFEPFYSMNRTIRSRLKEIMQNQEEEDERLGNEIENGDAEEVVKQRVEEWAKSGPAIVPALLKSLCHINRLHPIGGDFNQHAISNLQSSTTGHHLEGVEDGSGFQARILVLNNTPERGSGGYVGLMNGVFAAQKRKTPIDVINLANTDSIFLQQAAHLTQGIYYRIPTKASLLMYLNMLFLPPPSLRPKLALPSQDRVDFRAVCFCHQNVVDIGFVCSVCLSIFCTPQPICSTCKSRFPLATVSHLKKAMPAVLLNGSASKETNRNGPVAVVAGGMNGVAVSSPLASATT